MKIAFLDLKKINAELEQEVQLAVHNVVANGWYILGKVGEAFEEHCKAALVGGDEGYVIGCNSGTDALVLALLAADIGPGDEVVTVSHTAIPTICAINAAGATPVFVDIDPATWVMDIGKVRTALSSRTKAIIPVHLYGNMVDLNALKNALAACGRKDISIIEDVAQAQGSKLNGFQAGTLGRFGAFSFYPSKNIGALGDGGAVFCRTTDERDALKSLRNYGQSDRYHAERRRGVNSRLDEIQAAVLDVKLKYLASWSEKKKKLMDRYRELFSGLPVTFQAVTNRCEPAWHLCVIAADDKKAGDSLRDYLTRAGVQTLVHYPVPNHRQKAFSDYARIPLPVTENLAGRILSLPLNTGISDDEVEYVAKSIKAFFK